MMFKVSKYPFSHPIFVFQRFLCKIGAEKIWSIWFVIHYRQGNYFISPKICTGHGLDWNDLFAESRKTTKVI